MFMGTPAMRLTDRMPNRQDIAIGNASPKWGTPLWTAQRSDPKESPNKYSFDFEHPRPGAVGQKKKLPFEAVPEQGGAQS